MKKIMDIQETGHDNLNIGIIAYTTFPGGGLMNFLFQAIQSLSNARPNWNFHIIGSISFQEIEQCTSSNVRIQYWDNDFLTVWIYKIGSRVLKWLGKGESAGFLLQKRAEKYGLPWGNQRRRQELIKDMDALWVPHFNISLDRLAFDDTPYKNLPVLFTIHDIHPFFYPDDHPADDIDRFFRNMVPFAKGTQCIVTHSQFQKKAIRDNLSIDAEKIYVTPQPPLNKPDVLQKAFHSGFTNEILQKYGITRSFGFFPASTAHKHKNHLNLFNAWAKLKTEMGDDCPLLVCTGKGNRTQYQQILVQIKSLHLENDVIFTGGLDPSALAILYQNCSFVVIPTLYEGAGSGILTDALMAGKPVACSDIPQIKEQLAALEVDTVSFFDPEKVMDITHTIRNIIIDSENQNISALDSQSGMNQKFDKMWKTWAEDYARIIKSMVISVD